MTPGAAEAAIIAAVSEITGSKKYSGLDAAVVERVVRETLPKYRNAKDAVKAAKRELHIITASFAARDCHDKAGASLDVYRAGSPVDAHRTGSPPGVCNGGPPVVAGGILSDKGFARELLALHASTAQRLGQAEEIYARACAGVGVEDSVADLGCGYNPFSLPFWPTLPRAYRAYDIDARMVSLLNRYFEIAGTDYRAEVLDAASAAPTASPSLSPAAAPVPAALPAAISADVLFMFKLFPLLEHRKKGRGFEALVSAGFRDAVVSFPTRSASGRDRGMEKFYGELFERGLPSALTIADRRVYANEMFYFVRHAAKDK